jgi:hypothetical protein
MIYCSLNDKRVGNWKAAECARQRFSLPHLLWSYVAFYPVGTGDFFLVVATFCEWIWPLSPVWQRVEEWMECYLHSLYPLSLLWYDLLQYGERYLVLIWSTINRGHMMAQLVEALCYKPKGCGFDSSWSDKFFFDILLAALWPWGRLNLLQKWVPGIFPGG